MSDFIILWTAPVMPSRSLAGIPLGVSVSDFEEVLNKYALNDMGGIYGFVNSPTLRMERSIDSKGDGGYGFHVVDLELTNWRLYYDSPDHAGVETRALHVLTRDWKVYAVKVWMYECLADGAKPVNSYQGTLPEGIGLGSFVRELLPYTDLEFDSAEEWFYTSEEYGGLEVTGYCSDLNDKSDQIITALTVVNWQ
ncbi:hypothetical protein [Pseudomonas sp. NFACC39-1]|uniref:hypothetical protein n=1 Tax=Pseudomonas sp. NFACC39-1 TaxID=1566195 RepID=UPI0008AC3554|nr:hypothetical protein [Pseudomonas sp. NFACC39-1]SEN45668.1 hypothetical protein SAMN03159293_00017 [Pseudomonas sp. NFACC39-1]